MGVLFTTDKSTSPLYNPDLSADDMDRAANAFVTVNGYGVNGYNTFDERVEFHVSTRHITMWWDRELKPYDSGAYAKEAVHA